MSSNSTVCQGLQSCLAPLIPNPNSSMHPLLPSKQDLSFPCPENQRKCHQNGDNSKSNGAWNFILALTSSSYNSNRKFTSNDQEQVYVHPHSGGSVSPLSKISLEMCTESLGSETGTYIDSITDEFSSCSRSLTRPSTNNPKTSEIHNNRSKHHTLIPPPLTSIRERYCVHLLQIHREDGRLVIKSTRFPSCRACFKSERVNGRLRLSLRRDRYQAESAASAAAEFHISEHKELADPSGSLIGGKLGLGEWSGGGRCNGDDHQGGNQLPLPNFPIYVAMS